MMGLGIAQDLSALGGYARSFVSRASTKTYIDPSGVLQTAGVNVPAYQNGALLVEGAATNLLAQSSNFNVSPWTLIQTTVTQNTDVAPDGSTSMSTLTGVSGKTSYVQQVVTGLPSNTLFSPSIYIKAGTATRSRLVIYDNAISTIIASVVVGWSAGSPPSFSTSGTWTLAPFLVATGESGVYRLGGAISTGSFTGLAFLYYPDSNNTGLASKAWGADLEQGAFPTSYIYTTSAPVTRAADITAQI